MHVSESAVRVEAETSRSGIRQDRCSERKTRWIGIVREHAGRRNIQRVTLTHTVRVVRRERRLRSRIDEHIEFEKEIAAGGECEDRLKFEVGRAEGRGAGDERSETVPVAILSVESNDARTAAAGLRRLDRMPATGDRRIHDRLTVGLGVTGVATG